MTSAVMVRPEVAAALSASSQALLSLLPDEAAVRRFQRVTLQAIEKSPAVAECTPDSIIAAVMEAASYGLEPTGGVGGAHLVPRSKKVSRKGEPDRWEKRAQLVIDYRGAVQLVTRRRRDGSPSAVLAVSAEAVKEGDEFAYAKGTSPSIEHTPSLSPTRSASATTHVYAVAEMREGVPQFVVMDHAEVEAIRQREKADAFSPWSTDWDEMAKKTAVKRLVKLLPVEPDVRAILSREDEDREAPSPAPVAPTGPRTARLAARLRPQAAEEAPSDPDPVVVVSEPEPDRVLCTDASPYGDGSVCTKPTGHAGHHANAARESWERKE